MAAANQRQACSTTPAAIPPYRMDPFSPTRRKLDLWQRLERSMTPSLADGYDNVLCRVDILIGDWGDPR